MTKLFVIQNINRLNDEQLAEAIASKLITVEDLRKFLPSISDERVEAINEQISYAMVGVDYEAACSANTVEAYRAFIDKYPKHHYAHQVQTAIDALLHHEVEAAWTSCQQLDDPKLYQDFLTQYPNSKYAPQALQRLEGNAWEQCDKNDIQALRNYLATYPNGSYATIAEGIIEELERIFREEDDMWAACQERNSLASYESYIRQYPAGKYTAQARLLADDIRYQEAQVKRELFDEMRHYPEKFLWAFVADVIRYNEVEYNNHRISLTEEELIDNDLIRRSALNYIASGITFHDAPQSGIDKLPKLPNGNTDVYFFGVPASGKSTVLSALLTLGDSRGLTQYKTNMLNGIDPCISYYEALITNLGYEMLPPRTGTETCNTMGVDLYTQDQKYYNPLSFIEIGGEYFVSITENLSGTVGRADVATHGATIYLGNDNRKMIFFLIDYSTFDDTKLDIQQKRCLSRALSVFSEMPIFSKTDTVCVIVTKSDKMGVYDPEERYQEAHKYLTNRHNTFMEGLTKACQKFGMNKEQGYRPIVMTFSIGKIGIGNTVNWNTQDAEILLEFIRNHSRSHRSTPSLWDKITDAFKH